MRHAIICFPSDMMFSINKSKYLERKIWLEVELLFSFRLMFSERSLVRIDSHEWTLNLPQNMIFQINSETTLARRWCNTWERWLLWTAYCLLLFEPLVKKATLVFVDQQKKLISTLSSAEKLKSAKLRSAPFLRQISTTFWEISKSNHSARSYKNSQRKLKHPWTRSDNFLDDYLNT